MTRRDMMTLAGRFRTIRPQVGFDNAGRRLWADMVNAVTGTIIPEPQVRDFRATAGWEAVHDRNPLGADA